jgi:rod shape-determining protein MreB
MIGRSIKNLLINDLAIDLGTVNTLVYLSGRGIILNEPSTLATNKYTSEVVALGRAAERMFGREPFGVAVHHPLKDGTIAEFDLAAKLIKGLLCQAGLRERKYTRAILGIPVSATDVERNALSEAARQAGINEIKFVDEGLAAAIGIGATCEDGLKMVVDIGGGSTSFSVVSSYGALLSWCLKVAGTAMTRAIIDYIDQEHHVMIGYRTAEEIKIRLGYATEPDTNSTLQVIGKSIDGIPQVVEVCAVHVMQALDRTIQSILSGVHCVFKQAPPDVAHEINRSGIILTGGGSLIRNLEKRFADELGIPIQRAENPLEAVILGAGQFVENPGLFGKFNVMSEMPDWDLATDAYTLHDNEKHEAKSSIV